MRIFLTFCFFILSFYSFSQDYFDSFDPWKDPAFIRETRIRSVKMEADSVILAVTAVKSVEVTFNSEGKVISRFEDLGTFGRRKIFYAYTGGEIFMSTVRNNDTSRTVTHFILKEGKVSGEMSEKDGKLLSFKNFSYSGDTVIEETTGPDGNLIHTRKKVADSLGRILYEEEKTQFIFTWRDFRDGKCFAEKSFSKGAEIYSKKIEWNENGLPSKVTVFGPSGPGEIINYEYDQAGSLRAKSVIRPQSGISETVRFSFSYF